MGGDWGGGLITQANIIAHRGKNIVFSKAGLYLRLIVSIRASSL